MVMVLFYLTNIYNIRVRQKNYWDSYNGILKKSVRKYEVKLSKVTLSYKSKKMYSDETHISLLIPLFLPTRYG